MNTEQEIVRLDLSHHQLARLIEGILIDEDCILFCWEMREKQ